MTADDGTDPTAGPGPGTPAAAAPPTTAPAAPSDTTSDADLWERFTQNGVDPDSATALVKGRGTAHPADMWESLTGQGVDPDSATALTQAAIPNAGQASIGTVIGKSALHGAASAPASLLSTPGDVGQSYSALPTALAAAEGPIGAAGKLLAGPVAGVVGKMATPLAGIAQKAADWAAPAPTPAEIGPGKLRNAAAQVADVGGNLAAGAAMGAGTGAVAGRVLGMGAEDATLGQLAKAKTAERAAYTAAGPQVLSHPDIDAFMQSSVPEIQDANAAATDALNIRAARAGVTPQHLSQLQQAVRTGSPAQTIQQLGLSPQQAQAALAVVPGGPTTVEKFDLVRRGVQDAINATFARAKQGTAVPADLARAQQLKQWVGQVTPIADQQVNDYASARLAHGQVAGLNNAADYLASKGGNTRDLADLIGSGVWAYKSGGGYPLFRAFSAGTRLAMRGAEASSDLTPQGSRLLNAAKWLAARQNAGVGAQTGLLPRAAQAAADSTPSR